MSTQIISTWFIWIIWLIKWNTHSIAVLRAIYSPTVFTIRQLMLQKRNKNNKNKTGLWKKYSLALDLCVYCADVRSSITSVAIVYKNSWYYRYCHSCYFLFLDVHNSSLGLLCTSCFLQYLTLVVSCIWSCAHVCCARANVVYIFSSVL